MVFDVDSKIRAEQFKFFASALQSSKLKSYVPLFVKESEVNVVSACAWCHSASITGSSGCCLPSVAISSFWWWIQLPGASKRSVCHMQVSHPCNHPTHSSLTVVHKAAQGYIGTLLMGQVRLSMLRFLQDYFASWPQEGTVDLFEKIAELIIMTASRTLMGETASCLAHDCISVCLHLYRRLKSLRANRAVQLLQINSDAATQFAVDTC